MGIVWIIVLLVTGLAGWDFVVSIARANGAPQQAAAAAIDLFIVVGAYVIARAIEGVARAYPMPKDKPK